ncbi:MAG: M28 family peptidase [Nitrospiraceae bacterium]|nr:M28 family peptidase [Nitrospiraceae bacterium]
MATIVLLRLPTATAATEVGVPAPDEAVLPLLLNAISTERMLADIRALSAPDFNGRQTGTPNDLASALLVQDRLSKLGRSGSHQPLAVGSTGSSSPINSMQARPVPFTTIDEETTLRLSWRTDERLASIGADYLPVLDSPSVHISAPVVFVGYGIVDPEHGLNEYDGIDVRDKIVLFLRGKPERYGRQVSHAEKVRTAKMHGAIAYLTATGPLLTPYETRRGVTGRPSAFYGQVPSDQVIPGAWISTTLASAVLAEGGDDNRLRSLQQKISETGTPQSSVTATAATLAWTSVAGTGQLHNVLSLLPGTTDSPHTSALVIGAHRDHFGRQGGLLFAGADDNASGTAVLLEVARVLASAPTLPLHPILFVSFSGEEQGLIGSREYVAHPPIPLNSTMAMINVDHAGTGNGRLTVGVTDLDKQRAQAAGQAAQLEDRIDLFGFFPGGDHVPFKEAGVPTVTVVSGGVHPQFHQASDTTETIDPAILTAVARYVTALAWQLATSP